MSYDYFHFSHMFLWLPHYRVLYIYHFVQLALLFGWGSEGLAVCYNVISNNEAVSSDNND